MLCQKKRKEIVMGRHLKVNVSLSVKQDVCDLGRSGVDVCRSAVANALAGKRSEHRAAVYMCLAAVLVAQQRGTLTVLSDGSRVAFGVRQGLFDALRFRTDEDGRGLYVMLHDGWFRALDGDMFSLKNKDLLEHAGQMRARARIVTLLRKFSAALV